MSFGDHRVLADQPALETTICWLTNELWRPVRADWLIGFGDLTRFVGQPALETSAC